MSRVYSSRDLEWHGDVLSLGRRGVACVVPDDQWPHMWRVRMPDGRLTDMVNRTRAKDAAIALALASLNRKPDTQETASEAPPMRLEAAE